MLLRHVNRQPCDVNVGTCVLKPGIDRVGGVLPVNNDEQQDMGD